MFLSPKILWFFAAASSASDAALQVGSLNLSASLLWLLIGVVFCVAEVVLPTAFTELTMGLSAFVVALVVTLVPLPLAIQIGLWAIFSLLFVYLSHRLMPKRKAFLIQDAVEAQTLTEILPGKTGRVLYEGNSWRARCADEQAAIAPDERVYIVGRQGTTLIVMSENVLT